MNVLKIIIAGNGKTGGMLTRQLSQEGYDITVIDSDREALSAESERFDIITCEGNCASAATLREAGILTTGLLVAATGNDEVNLLCCMTAKSLNPKIHTIARIKNAEYHEQVYGMKDIFAISMAFNPELQTAVEIDRLIRYPGFLKRDTFTKGRDEIVELKIHSGSRLCGKALSEIRGIVKAEVLVCAVLRGGEAIAPDGRFVLQAGDRIFVTATADNLSAMLKSLDIYTRKVKNVMIAGGSRLSVYLATLLAKRRVDVKIIEKDAELCKKLSERLPDAEIICADASLPEVLESEGIRSCDALVTLTGMDELNVIISLYGNAAEVPQTITKLGRIDGTEIVRDLSIGSTVNPGRVACDAIVRYVRAVNNQTGAAISLHLIADGHVEAIEFAAEKGTLHLGEPLRQIRFKKNVLVACVTRDGEPHIPNGDSDIREGDTVIIVSVGGNKLLQLNDIFE
jgi:trk system potassium uptake protein TrkA